MTWLDRLGRWLAITIVCVALPLGLIAHGVNQARQRAWQAAVADANTRLEQALFMVRPRVETSGHLAAELCRGFAWATRRRNWMAWTRWLAIVAATNFSGVNFLGGDPRLIDANLALNRHLQFLTRLLPDDGATMRDVARWRRDMIRRFPGLLEIVVVDRHGQVVPGLSDVTSPADAMRILFRIQAEVEPLWFVNDGTSNRSMLYEPWMKIIHTVTGNRLTPSDLEGFPSHLARTANPTRRAWVWAMAAPEAGAVCHIHRTPDWDNRATYDRLRQLRGRMRRDDVEAGWFEPDGSTALAEAPILRAMARSGQDQRTVGRRQWRILQVHPRLYLWGCTPLPDPGDARTPYAVAAVVWLIGAVPTWRILADKQYSVLPIRRQLTGLFVLASALPLLFIVVVGEEFIANRAQERREAMVHDLENRLQACDRGFRRQFTATAHRVNRALAGRRYALPQERAQVQRILNAMPRTSRHFQIYILDREGKLLWQSWNTRGQSATQRSPLIGRICSVLLATLNQELGSVTGVIILNFFESLSPDRDIVAESTRALGSFIQLQMGKNPMWIYNQPMWATDGRAHVMVAVNWDHGRATTSYVRNWVRRAEHRDPAVHFLAFSRGSLWPEEKTGRFRLPARLTHVAAAADYYRSTVVRPCRPLGRQFLAVGTVPRDLDELYLVAVQSTQGAVTQVRRERRFLYGAALLGAAINLFLAALLTRHFVRPIDRLADGVRAIHRRDFRIALPVPEGDELGDLTRAFNDMVEGLADLDVARIVQERLFPTGPIRVGQLTLYGGTRPAAELGGDYFDLRPLTDGRVLFLIGDVMGHGVPAGLVMAMAKAMVAAAEQEAQAAAQTLTPEAILQKIQDVVYASMRMNRMFTCMVGIADPGTDTITLANAGHNFPYLIRPDGSVANLKLPVSFPLAARRKAGFAPLTLTLAPGERLLFYTDGFMEAATGESLGYERSVAGAAAQPETDAADWYRAVLAWHSTVTRPGPQDDDITLLLVCRNPTVSNTP